MAAPKKQKVATKPAAPAAKQAPPAPKPKTPKPKGTVDAVDFVLLVRDPGGTVQTYDDVATIPISPPDWFAAKLVGAKPRRFVHLVQREVSKGMVVLIQLADTQEGAVARIPPAPAWQRAIVDGTIHVLAADQPLTRERIVAVIGGHEPPPTDAKPPFT